MSALRTQDLQGDYQSEEQAVFALLQKIERLQKEYAIYLRGSLAYYGILGFCGRHCNDIDLAAFDPAEAAHVLGLSVDTSRIDCIEGHIGYTLCGIRNILSVEILRYPRDTNTVTVSFPFIVANKCWRLRSDFTVGSCCRIACISLEQIITEKLFSMAYALREEPTDEHPLYKNLFDLSQAFRHRTVHRFFSSRDILCRYMEAYLYIERDRENRFTSIEQMLTALSRIADISICPSKFIYFRPISIQGEHNIENEHIVAKALLASLERTL